MIEDQEKSTADSQALEIETDKATGKKKSIWKKAVKDSDIRGKKEKNMAGRKKCWTIENDEWGKKKHVKESNSGAIKDIIKIRLNMWELKANYRRKDLDNRCLMCQSEGDTQNMSWNVTKETRNSI